MTSAQVVETSVTVAISSTLTRTITLLTNTELPSYFFFSNESIGVTTGRAFCGVVGHRDRHEYTGISINYVMISTNSPILITSFGERGDPFHIPKVESLILFSVAFEKVNKKDNEWISHLAGSYRYSRTSPYGHLYNTDASITDCPNGSKETKFHTNSTSTIRTPP